MSKRRLVITAVLAGSSQSEVARTYGVSQSWISRLMARYAAEGERRSSRGPELLRELTLDPARDYQPTGRRPGPTPKKH